MNENRKYVKNMTGKELTLLVTINNEIWKETQASYFESLTFGIFLYGIDNNVLKDYNLKSKNIDNIIKYFHEEEFYGFYNKCYIENNDYTILFK